MDTPQMIDRITVKAPATSANLGPGFDCLAMALDIWNTVEVVKGPDRIAVRGEGQGQLPADRTNLVYSAFRLPFVERGEPVPSISMTCDNAIPLERGLGSSSAAIAAGLLAGSAMCSEPLTADEILKLAVRTEGHPDNVAAALRGGFQIVVEEDGQTITAAIPVPAEWTCVIFVPGVPMPTEEARSLLAEDVTRKDAVHNLGRVALLVRAFSTGDSTHLAVATRDRLHQPAREGIFHAMKPILRAALAAGAHGAFLSGAGSSILAITSGREMTVGYEMAEAASKSGVEGEFRVTKPTDKGAHISFNAQPPRGQ
jgi:homoserine kinase